MLIPCHPGACDFLKMDPWQHAKIECFKKANNPYWLHHNHIQCKRLHCWTALVAFGADTQSVPMLWCCSIVMRSIQCADESFFFGFISKSITRCLWKFKRIAWLASWWNHKVRGWLTGDSKSETRWTNLMLVMERVTIEQQQSTGWGSVPKSNQRS